MATSAPSPASARATARPIPVLPPVMSATLSFNRSIRFTWGPRHGPQAPQRSERPGKPVALLDFALSDDRRAGAAGRRLRDPVERGDHRALAAVLHELDRRLD